MWRPEMLAVLVALGLLAAADARTLTPRERASLATAGFLRDSAESLPVDEVAGDAVRGAHRSSLRSPDAGRPSLALRAVKEMRRLVDRWDTELLDADLACNDGAYYPDPDSCDKYFMCVHGKLVPFDCPATLHWNRDKHVCDWPTDPGCKDVPVPATTTVEPRTTTEQPTTPPVPPEPVNPIDRSGFKVVCYFTNWAWYRPGVGKYRPSDVDPDLCTHIVYAFAILDASTNSIKAYDTWADIDNKFYRKVAAYRAKGVKVTVAIGGWSDSAGNKYSTLVNSPSARRRFVQSVLHFIEKYGFDGLDLDWEYPKCWQVNCKLGPESDKEGFAALVAELRAAFRPKGYLLSAAVSASKKVIDFAYDVPALSRDLDWIAVMTYDYHGQWDGRTGHVAPMSEHAGDADRTFNVEFSIDYWISKGADRKKLVLGMPMYGKSFTLASSGNHGLNAPTYGGGEAGEFTRARGTLAYYEICFLVQRSGWTVVRDPTGAMGPYAYRGNQWVGYDDVAMIRTKSEWAKEMGLGGGMIWALDLDDFSNRCGGGKYPLLKTINRVLRGYRSPDPEYIAIQD